MSAHGSWPATLSTFERHAKAWLAVLFGLPTAAVLAALEGAGVQLPVWATALLALLPIVTATAGVAFGPANSTGIDGPPVDQLAIAAPAPDVPPTPVG